MRAPAPAPSAPPPRAPVSRLLRLPEAQPASSGMQKRAMIAGLFDISPPPRALQHPAASNVAPGGRRSQADGSRPCSRFAFAEPPANSACATTAVTANVMLESATLKAGQ